MRTRFEVIDYAKGAAIGGSFCIAFIFVYDGKRLRCVVLGDMVCYNEAM